MYRLRKSRLYNQKEDYLKTLDQNDTNDEKIKELQKREVKYTAHV